MRGSTCADMLMSRFSREPDGSDRGALIGCIEWQERSSNVLYGL